MAERCAYSPCSCPALPRDRFCGPLCEALSAGLIGLEVKTDIPLTPSRGGTARCACGHAVCVEQVESTKAGYSIP